MMISKSNKALTSVSINYNDVLGLHNCNPKHRPSAPLLQNYKTNIPPYERDITITDIICYYALTFPFTFAITSSAMPTGAGA
jgi:hypothetical protein